MHRWLVDMAPVAIELFRKMDVDGEGAVTAEEFKAGDVLNTFFFSFVFYLFCSSIVFELLASVVFPVINSLCEHPNGFKTNLKNQTPRWGTTMDWVIKY